MRISKMVCGVLAAVVAMAATLSSATAGECPLSKKAVKVQAVKLAEKKDIVDTAVGAKSFTTLVAAVKAAGLVETLKSKGPFTVFAPTDDAFAALPAGLVSCLLLPRKKEANEMKSMFVTVGWKTDFVEKNMSILPIAGDFVVYKRRKF